MGDSYLNQRQISQPTIKHKNQCQNFSNIVALWICNLLGSCIPYYFIISSVSQPFEAFLGGLSLFGCYSQQINLAKSGQFYQMQGNFNINLPSIPTALIKFKIQDIKAKGFSAKQARFKDNKAYLENRFINSFLNLYPLSSPKSTSENQNTSKLSTNLSSYFRQQNDDFRFFVQDNKKNLLVKYQDQYKDYLPPIQGESKFDKGFSFPRSGVEDALSKQVSKHTKEKQTKIIDNYYFNHTQESQDEIEEQNEEKLQLERRREEKLARKKIVQPSAAFKSQDRWQRLEKELESKIKPGPGSYLFQNQDSSKKQKSHQKKDQKKKINAERIKFIFQNSFNPQKPVSHQPQTQQNPVKVRSSSMFIEGNLDRFGNQVYPISNKLNVPGPGAYMYNDSLEDKANKILVLEEQRKLLKEWYNQS